MKQNLHYFDSGDGSPLYEEVTISQMKYDCKGATKSTSNRQKRRKGNTMSCVLLIIGFLFIGSIQVMAADITPGNIIKQTISSGVDPDRGVYNEYMIHFYNTSGDYEQIYNANFYYQDANKNDIRIFEVYCGKQNTEEPWVDITALNGFHLLVKGENRGDWQDCRSGSKVVATDRTNGSGACYVFVRVFLPQSYLNISNRTWIFSAWDTRAFSTCKPTGTFTDTSLPTMSKQTVELDRNTGNMIVNFNLSKGLACNNAIAYPYRSGAGVSDEISFNSSTGISSGKLIVPHVSYSSFESYVYLRYNYSKSGYIYYHPMLNNKFNMTHIRYVSSHGISDDGKGNIKVNWKLDSGATGSGDPYNSNMTVSVKLPGSSSWSDLSPEQTYQSSSDATYNFSYEIPSNYRQKGSQTFTFAVRRSCFNQSIITATGIPYYTVSQRSVTVQTDYEKPTKIDFDNATRNLYIKTQSGLKPDNLKHIVTGFVIKDNTAIVGLNVQAKPLSDDHPKKKEGYSYYIESGIGTCTPSRFEVQTKIDNNSVAGYLLKLEDIMYKPDANSSFLSFTASKGYYNDRVDLRFKIDPKKNNFTAFVLKRYLITPDSIFYQKEVDRIKHDKFKTEYLVKDDNTSGGLPPAPGSYYRYTVDGLVICDEDESVTSSLSDIGFAEALGTISGKIAMSGGTAVENVDILFTNADTDNINSLGVNKALDFGPADTLAYVLLPTSYIKDSRNLSIQFYAQINANQTANGEQQMFYGGTETDQQLKLWLDSDRRMNMQVFKNTPMKLDTILPMNKYFHFSAVLSQSGSIYTYTAYIDGKKIATLTTTESRSLSFTSARIGGDRKSTKINGLLDEYRIWGRALDDKEIKKNFNRYIPPKTTKGLRAYYRFDESDYVDNAIFDSSYNTDYEYYNENHAISVNFIKHNANDIPDPDQLAYKVQTDENGNYNSGLMLPFKNSGTLYSVRPSFGIHTFNPGQKTLNLDMSTATVNATDFTDVSSFEVTGRVTFENSEYPVDSVMILIDGIVASKDGKAVMTGSDGKYTVDVPIGEHFISMSKQGHIFADEGRFPKDPGNKGTRYNFVTSEKDIDFTDQTTVTLIGRVVGGTPQTEKKVGFGLSNANIGKAKITLKAGNDTDKLWTLNDSTKISLIGGKESKTTFRKYSASVRNIVEVETNPETGEFLAVVPPVPFDVIGVKTVDFEDGDGGEEVSFNYNKMRFNMNPFLKFTTNHTKDKTSKKETISFNDSLIVTRYNDPVIHVVDKNNSHGAFGDSLYVYTDNVTGKKDSINLYSVVNNKVEYALGVPVLSQKIKEYTWNVKAFETYVNKDNSLVVYDTIPCANGVIEINNALAAERIDLDENYEVELSRDDSNISLALDSVGNRDYSFRVSFPNTAGNNQLGAKFTLEQNGKDIIWEQKSILLGQIPSSGNNFVTKGPDNVDFILHDPPGSNSYAYLEKGSSFTFTKAHTDVVTATEALNLTIQVGPEIRTGTGIGFMVMSTAESKVDIEIGAEVEEVSTKNNEKQTTLTFNQQISTSSDPNYVGSMADVYIGRGTNVVFGMMNQLALYPTNQVPEGTTPSLTFGGYSLFQKRVLTSDVEFGTMFYYTQTSLLENHIPNIKELRNQLITPITNPQDTLNIYFGEDKIKYVSFLPANDPKFGEPETYYVFYAPNAKEEKAASKDDIQEYNTWIKTWQQRIAENEEGKINLYDKRAEFEANAATGVTDAYWNNKRYFENVSFDAGVGIEKSLEVNYENIKIDGAAITAGGSLGATSGLAFNKVGVVANAVVGAKREQGDEYTETDGNSMKFGYVLAEDESVFFAGKDVLSVDVYGPTSDMMIKHIKNGKSVTNLSGFTFRTRAGQTSCPYEPADSTLFYKNPQDKPVLLNYGTFKIENANLFIDNKNEASQENISTGRTATFTLQMQNLSESKLDVTYQLYVDGSTNPDGLILELDGQPLTAARQYRINYGEEVTKTLKVRQSSLDVLNYDKIALRLGSVCDIETYSEAYISVNFTPSSSPVSLAASSQLVNRHVMDEMNGKVTFTISDYDVNFKNFEYIKLQQKRAGENWPITSIYEFVKDANKYPLNDRRKLIEGATCKYDFVFEEAIPSDGEYVFRAVAVSIVGNDEVISTSEEITVVKDVKNPEVLGNPSPATGILNIGEEVSITFNEDLQTGLISDRNFTVTGILNADIRQEPTVGLAFDGTGKASTEAAIYTNGSFSIETWFKRPENKEGTLFSYGEGNSHISLGFDATGRAKVKIGNEEKISTEVISPSEAWKYVGLSYNRDKATVSVYAMEDTKTIEMFKNTSFAQTPSTQGKLYVGNNTAGNNGFHGAVGLLHFYGNARSEGDMNLSKSLVKSGIETDLIGLWNLEEGEGNVAQDKARSRNLVLNTDWYIYPTGRSLAFNGTSQYATIQNPTVTFRAHDDFTFEFWFKGGEQNAATLLSANDNINIGFDSKQQMILDINGSKEVLTTNNLLDDKWHHFALSVKRTGVTNAIIDGKTTATFNSSVLSTTVIRGTFYLGAKYQTGTPAYTEYFKGNIDEFRLWNSALTSKVLVLDKNNKLRGSEAGLRAYFPFEVTEKRDKVWMVYESLNDVVDPSISVKNMTTTSTISAPLQDSRPVKNVAFTVTPSDRKVVLNILEEDYRIEGVTLNIEAKEIYDMHNNSSDVKRWIAYVNRNALNWGSNDVNLTIAENEGTTFKATITNSSGAPADYYIEDLPMWLSVNNPQGVLQPMASKELTFTVPQSVNIGHYETSVALTGVNDVRKVLPVSLKVTGQRPGWSVNPNDFESSMNITGQIKIDGIFQEDAEDILAAFIGDLCVGITSPIYINSSNAYFSFANIYGNEEHKNKALTFKLWDASTGRTYPKVETSIKNISFVSSSIVGSLSTPVTFNALDIAEQNIGLRKGWNWISTNVYDENPDILKQMKSSLALAGDMIKGHRGYIQQPGWLGTLDSVVKKSEISEKLMYIVKTNREHSLMLEGKSINPTTTAITINNGWNWIGYIPSFALPLKNALAGINPQDGDYIKGQTGYATYSGSTGWVGNLSYMQAGKGYMYYSNNTNPFTLIYPSAASQTIRNATDINESNVASRWNTDYSQYAGTMTLTAIAIKDDIEMRSDKIEIAAFNNNECRGSAILQYVADLDRYMGFLMVYGNSNEDITLKVYDHDNNSEYTTNNAALQFANDAIHGNPTSPYSISIGVKSGIEDINLSQVVIYPNPVSIELFINRPWESIDLVEITDLSGRTILSTINLVSESINVSKLASGVYLVKLTHNGQTVVKKFTKY